MAKQMLMFEQRRDRQGNLPIAGSGSWQGQGKRHQSGKHQTKKQ